MALLPELPVSNLVTGTTAPSNGDVNPYGVAFVPRGFAAGGPLSAGDVLVSNVLSGAVTRLQLSLSAKNDTATILNQTQIASGYATAPNIAALLVGPTGLVFDAARDELFVASPDDNAVYAISDALKRDTDSGKGTLIYQDAAHLHGPLGLVLAPNGDLITSNGDAINADPTQPSELVEFTQTGQFVAETPVDSSGEGGAFGIAVRAPSGKQVSFAAADDLTNALNIWKVNSSAPHRH